MKAFTQRDVIKQVTAKWERQYEGQMDSTGYLYPGGKGDKTRGETLKQLQALDLNTCTAKEVNDIIGNESWTRMNLCDECGKQPNVLVQVGNEPDYDSHTAWLCLNCLSNANALAQNATKQE